MKNHRKRCEKRRQNLQEKTKLTRKNKTGVSDTKYDTMIPQQIEKYDCKHNITNCIYKRE